MWVEEPAKELRNRRRKLELVSKFSSKIKAQSMEEEDEDSKPGEKSLLTP